MDKLDKYTFYIVIIDILFLPLFPLVSVSMSLPVISYWYLLRGKRTHVFSEYKLLPTVVVLMFISSIIGVLFPMETAYDNTFATTIKRLFMFWTAFWYFLFFKYCFIKYNKEITSYIFWSIIYMAVFAIIYLIFQDQFMQYKAIINPADPHTRRFLSGDLYGVYRYTYLWADANNVAYAIGGMSLFYIHEEHFYTYRKYIVLAATIFILLCTMSIGGMGVAISLLLYSFVMTDAFKAKGYTVILSILLVILIIYFTITNWGVISDFIDSGLASRFNSYDGSEDMSGGRLNDFNKALSRMSPLFLLIGSGLEGFSAENGHLYLIGMYGVPVYIYYLYVYFAKRKGIVLKRYCAIIPFFVGFTMNIAIIEQKFLLILLLISAYLSADSFRRSQRRSDL